VGCETTIDDSNTLVPALLSRCDGDHKNRLWI